MRVVNELFEYKYDHTFDQIELRTQLVGASFVVQFVLMNLRQVKLARAPADWFTVHTQGAGGVQDRAALPPSPSNNFQHHRTMRNT